MTVVIIMQMNTESWYKINFIDTTDQNYVYQITENSLLNSDLFWCVTKAQNSPIDAGDIDNHINHITAQFIGLHVHRRAVCGDVDLTDHVKQKGLLYPWILSPTRRQTKDQQKKEAVKKCNMVKKQEATSCCN